MADSYTRYGESFYDEKKDRQWGDEDTLRRAKDYTDGKAGPIFELIPAAASAVNKLVDDAALAGSLADERDEARQYTDDQMAAVKAYTDEEIAAASLATQKWLPSVDTRSMLPAVSDVNQTYLCRVIRDQTSSNNGVWQWIGGAGGWTFFSDNLDFITASDAASLFQEKLPSQGAGDAGKALIASGAGGFSFGEAGKVDKAVFHGSDIVPVNKALDLGAVQEYIDGRAWANASWAVL